MVAPCVEDTKTPMWIVELSVGFKCTSNDRIGFVSRACSQNVCETQRRRLIYNLDIYPISKNTPSTN